MNGGVRHRPLVTSGRAGLTDLGADEHAGEREGEAHHADDQARQGNRHAQQRETQPHGQRVYARGDGKQQQRRQTRCAGRRIAILPEPQRLVDHLPADQKQQAERDPMIHLADHVAQAQTRQPAQHGHERLEKTEEDRHAQRVNHVVPLEHRARRDGHRERVHGEADGYH
ncbi:MAG: hypothetical protein NTW87_17395 [Planctomycetota bacterium]|nr:hypothetical protein [Planctomycetota bacterium]